LIRESFLRPRRARRSRLTISIDYFHWFYPALLPSNIFMHDDRKRLPHWIPSWINPNEEVYFITVNCSPPGRNQLAHPGIASAIFDTVQFRNEKFIWFTSVLLLMPDHLHAIMSFPPYKQTIKDRIANWKRWLATHHRIVWQEDFFEHRLRSEQARVEKADYIINNPVRAGFVTNPEDWPFVWFAQRGPKSGSNLGRARPPGAP